MPRIKGKLAGVLVLLPVFFLLNSQVIFAQLKANFTTSSNTGCSPLLVQFIDSSRGKPDTWFWDLGTGTSVKQNPEAVYFKPGTYTIKLVIKNTAGTDSIIKTSYITVYDKPVVNFGQSINGGCVPLKVAFTDKSSSPSAAVTQWNWDFGDGDTSGNQNPVHNYTSAGVFAVTLNATNQFGCSQAYSLQASVKTDSIARAAFTYSYSDICKKPVMVSIKNLSSAASCQWDFGDGGSSQLPNPEYTYANNGKYNIRLIATSAAGCLDTLVKPVSIGFVAAAFSMPLSSCINSPAVFTDVSVPVALSVKWDFGDGAENSASVGIHTYSTPGNYKVKLVANFGNCIDSVTNIFSVTKKPVAAFSITGDTAVCKLPATVVFKNASVGGVSYEWDFGDGVHSNLPGVSHTYTRKGFFKPTLITSSANGCSDTATYNGYIKLGPPRIDSVHNLPFSGCVPVNLAFTPHISSGEDIASYQWSFGDGETSVLVNPAHTYSNAGKYNVTLITTTSTGCADTVILVNGVTLGNKPKAAFTASTRNACAITTDVSFTDASTGYITAWAWKFGNLGTSVYQNPGYRFTQTGDVSVSLTVYSNGCSDTYREDNFMHVNPPIANFTSSNDCKNTLHKFFYNRSDKAVSLLWSFGDGKTSTATNPEHTYATAGRYLVTLIAVNDTCSNTTADTVVIYNNKTTFSYAPAKTDLCRNDSVSFTALYTEAAYVKALKWDFGDNTSTSFGLFNKVTHKYAANGASTPRLFLRGSDGCIDTVYSNLPAINVQGPSAVFTNPVVACPGNKIVFKSNGDGQSNTAIVKWAWQFGDGATATLKQSAVTHTYKAAGDYNIILQVFDSNGCRDTLLKIKGIQLTKPTALFGASDSERCLPSPVLFNDSSAGKQLQYTWLFGDGQTSSVQSPRHLYASPGVYNVTLKVSDANGCADSITKTKFITINYPKALFNLNDTFSTCPPLLIKPENRSAGVESLLWDFDDGSSSVGYTPQHYYSQAGSYRVRLIVKGHGECYDTATKKVVLLGPSGKLVYSANNGCTPLKVSFASSNAKNVLAYVWAPGDNFTETTRDSFYSYTYTMPGVFLPKLTLIDSSGCQVNLSDSLKLFTVGSAKAMFDFKNPLGCDSSLVTFNNSSTVSFDTVSALLWNFGDGITSTIKQPVHYYTRAGVYNVTLGIHTKNGCTDNFSAPVNIQLGKRPAIKANMPLSACINQPVSFTAIDTSGLPGAIKWFWKFEGNGASSLQNPVYSYKKAQAYNVSVMATNESGCTDTVVNVVTVFPQPLLTVSPDTSVCFGGQAQLRASGTSQYLWQAKTSISCEACAIATVTPASTAYYYVTGTVNGCSIKDSVLVSVQNHLVLNTVPSNALCIGGTVQLQASGTDVYRWYPSTGLNNNLIPGPVAYPATTTVYTLTGSDKYGCFYDTAFVTVVVDPLPDFKLLNTVVSIRAGDAYKIDVINAVNVARWSWFPVNGLSCSTCSTVVASPDRTTTYTVTATSRNGCDFTQKISIHILCNSSNMFVPNTFSPNGDGMNDQFFPRGSSLYFVKKMIVFNRWGQIVFEKNNFRGNDASVGWDGRYKNILQPPDVYIYLIEAYCNDGKLLTSKGSITLIR